ncbi:MAG: phosphoribosylanthranilate isomerase [Planctomycetes bacterium]|nr:phosphoribosylanthranilate isomerase [Planctomycetota bacterium]
MPVCRVKVCGITRAEDALLAAEFGAAAIGLIFAESKRQVTPDAAADIVRQLPPFVTPVGVFVNERPEEIRRLAERCGLGAVQLHGDETPDDLRALAGLKTIKVVRVRDRSSLEGLAEYPASAFLLDTYSAEARGGTGQTFDWQATRGIRFPAPVILSGGLHAENVARAIEQVQPHAVDVSSGVESAPGIKDPGLLRRFFEAVRGTRLQRSVTST